MDSPAKNEKNKRFSEETFGKINPNRNLSLFYFPAHPQNILENSLTLPREVRMRKEPSMDLRLETAKQEEERNITKRQMNTHSLRETI